MANGARRLAAGVSLVTAAGGFAWLGLRHLGWVDWHAVAFAGVLAAAGVGLTRRWLVGQVFSRALAWIVFLPTAAVGAAEALRGHLDPGIFAFAATTGAALLLARPMLHTSDARAAFAPSRFRRSFLAACTASAAIAIVLGMVAYESLFRGHAGTGLALGALAASIAASAIGVLRMRGWGVALAALSSIVSLSAAALVGGDKGVALASTALPGALFVLPIVLAKLGVGEAEAAAAPPAHARVALPARVRVATEHEAAIELEEEAPAAVAQRA